ncbi:MAG: phosphoglycerate kinase, partial [Chloroflexi bacterium]|nr:phosphoglycerate kinase [Chloroflexota bacterium]
LNPGQLLLLENLRFHQEEEENDTAFARALASLAEVYVNDAFGTAHRVHASTEGVAHYMPAVAGLLMEQEIEMLGRTLEHPRRPLCAVMGGAKVSDKLGVLEHLLPRVNGLLIGGGMAATFLRAIGHPVGASLLEKDKVDLAAGILHQAEELGISFGLPQDVVVAETFSAESPSKVVSVDQIPDGWHIMDIGPQTVQSFQERLRKCCTILWNGPLGVMEYKRFAEGTTAIANLLANLTDATTIIGGGSTAEAVAVLGLADRMTHVSTGGGASLEFLEGRELPGIAVLLDKEVA